MVVAAIIQNKAGKVLLLKRHLQPNSVGQWSLPGGQVEPTEDLSQAVIREVEEECGLTMASMQVVHANKYTDSIEIFLCTTYSGRLKNKEPDKCEKLGWFSPSDFPTPLTSGATFAKKYLQK